MGSIIIPETVRDKMVDMTGEVLEVGKGTEHFDIDVKVGDEVLFVDKPTHYEVGDNKLINIEDVLLVYEK